MKLIEWINYWSNEASREKAFEVVEPEIKPFHSSPVYLIFGLDLKRGRVFWRIEFRAQIFNKPKLNLGWIEWNGLAEAN